VGGQVSPEGPKTPTTNDLYGGPNALERRLRLSGMELAGDESSDPGGGVGWGFLSKGRNYHPHRSNRGRLGREHP
jgi:hypothetical protein